METEREKYIKNPRPTCKICGENHAKQTGNFTRHLNNVHSISLEEYYLAHLYTERVDIAPACATCGKKTSFNYRVVSHEPHCSMVCVNKDPIVRGKQEEGIYNKLGVKRPLELHNVRAAGKNVKSTNALKKDPPKYIEEIVRDKKEEENILVPVFLVEDDCVYSSDDDNDGFTPL